MTSSPSSVSSLARIDPVQPRPMMTTSFFGSLRAMGPSAGFRRPVHSARDADGRKRKALVVTVDPVEIVVARPRVPDHPPRDHVAVAAIDRVGKEALLHVLDRLLEKRLSVSALELHTVDLETAENSVLVAVAELRKGFAGIVRAAIAVERRQALAIFLRRPGLGLRSLLLGSDHEGRAVVEALLPAIGTGHLAVDVDRATGVFSTRRIRVRRNDAVRHGFDGAALGAGEEKPWAWFRRNQRISRVRFPGKVIPDDCSAARHSPEQGKGGTSQQVPTTEAHGDAQNRLRSRKRQ